MMTDKQTQLVDNIRIAISQVQTDTDIYQTTVELIDAFSEKFNWSGFYIMKEDQLEVGPYIGLKTEHTKIDLDSGICGAAASKKESIIVNDVKADPRFLACSLSTRSEIVVPLLDGDQCLGEIDIDSDQPAAFAREDREMFEAIAGEVVKRLKQIAK